MSTEHRLIELETKIAFLDETIEDLNDVIASQQRQIDRLEEQIKSVIARLGAGASPEAAPVGPMPTKNL